MIHDVVNKLVYWLNGCGASLEGVTIDLSADGMRCLKSTRYHSRLDLFIPTSCIFSSLKSVSSPIGQAIDNSNQRFHSDVYILANLLYEKYQPNSIWRPYLDTLPQKYEPFQFPVQFNAEILNYLDGTGFKLKTECAQQYEHNCFQRLVKHVRGFHYNFDEYLWAGMTLQSRSFNYYYAPLNFEATALIPFIDMANHELTASNTFSYQPTKDKNGFSITSNRPIQEGDEINISYQYSGHDYYTNYGFVEAQTSICSGIWGALITPESILKEDSKKSTTFLSKDKPKAIEKLIDHFTSEVITKKNCSSQRAKIIVLEKLIALCKIQKSNLSDNPLINSDAEKDQFSSQFGKHLMENLISIISHEGLLLDYLISVFDKRRKILHNKVRKK